MGRQAGGRILLLVNPVFLVHRREVLRISPQALGSAEHQKTAGFERIVQSRDHPLLQHRAQVDQQIAATDQVQVGERRIFGHILLGKDAHLPYRFDNLISPVDSHEEPPQTLRRDAGDQSLGIEAGAGPVERAVADVGGENLERRGAQTGFGGLSGLQPQIFQHGHGQRVSLFAGGATGHPNPHRAALVVVPEQSG